MSATHELKTPIASLKLMLETFRKHEISNEQKQTLLNNALTETERLNTLIENMLVASQLESSVNEWKQNPINISQMTNDIIASFNSNQHNIIESNIQADIIIRTNTTVYSSILYNLIDNAIKYNTPGGKINVALQENNKIVALSVSDHGIGIDKSEYNHIFDRFYRIEDENTRKTKGTGLGLYIVKQLVQLHNGEIIISKNLPKGTTFVVNFNTH